MPSKCGIGKILFVAMNSFPNIKSKSSNGTAIRLHLPLHRPSVSTTDATPSTGCASEFTALIRYPCSSILTSIGGLRVQSQSYELPQCQPWPKRLCHSPLPGHTASHHGVG
ncbi:hypothetical protein ACH5RR_038462 [Cinchona calisaya]|uniref:Uncharacterized protein n=1 Tax=Cinchona calisaya TaxID=153742 RepID=A0ABD2Y120_9GENT